MPTPLIPRSILFGNPEKASPRLSPDGKYLAYLAPDQRVLNVWVRTLGTTDDRAVTHDRYRGIRSFFWQPASDKLIYLQDEGGNENFHLYQTDPETRETVDLTPFDNVRAMVVAADRNHHTHMLVALNRRDERLFDVYRLDYATGDLTLDTENPGDVSEWSADNALAVRGATAMRPDGGQEIRVRTQAGQPWRVFQSFGPDETPGGIAGFTPTNDAVLLVSSEHAEAARLLEVEIASGNSRVIAEDPRFDVSGTMTHPVTNHLEAVSFVREKVEWTVFEPAIQADFDAIRAIDPNSTFGISSRTTDDAIWLLHLSGDQKPARYYLYHRPEKRAEFLFSAYPSLDSYTLASMAPVTIPASDGLPLPGYLTRPVGAIGPTPMVLLVHGGPWARDVWGYSPAVQMLANRGYTVLQVNFRGSTGYGKAFLNAGDREWGARMQQDLTDAKNWAIAKGFTAAGKVAIMGGSYGGYAVLAGLAFTPEEFCCGVDIVGPSNLITLLNSIPPYWAPMRAIFDKRLGTVEHDEAFLRERSPLFSADRIVKPLLIGQGQNDPRVKRAESDQIVESMRAGGKTVEYLVFADEGHGFARPENSLRFFAATEQFLAKHLGGRAEQPQAGEDWARFLA